MKKVYFSLLMACFSILSLSAIAQTTTYNYTGAVQTFTVGSGYTTVTIDMAGAQGGSSGGSAPGGYGGRVQAQLAVTTGQVLYLYVGGVGTNQSYCASRAGGYNGGGNGYGYGGGGGGMSDIRIAAGAFSATNEILVAGGGGGAGYNYGNSGEIGGFGGGTTGGTGFQGSPASASPTYCGAGGTQTAGGAGSTGYGTPTGSFGQGGNCTGSQCYAGGGGGGWYGGGCGAYGGGGGGSSWLGGSNPNIISVSTTNGTNGAASTAGLNGYISITPLPPAFSSVPSSLAFGGVTSGTTSSPVVVTISGIALTGAAVTVTPPANYQISPDGTTWYTSSSPMTIPYTGTTFSNLYFVQFLPPSIGSFPGNIAVAGGGVSATYNIPVTGTGATACSGTPTAGSSTINGTTTASGNSSTLFTLNVPSATVAGGITYQWQVSTTSGTSGFSNIPGAVTASYVYSGLTANSWFQCIVSCGGSSATSGTVTATFAPVASSCTPAFNYTCSSYPMSTSINSLIGFSGSISDPGACGPNYVDNTGSMSVTLNGGTSYSITYGVSTSYYSSFAVELWIDFNDNGTFETSEIVGGQAQGFFTTSTGVGTLTVPAGAAPGAHRMRVVGIYCPSCYGFPTYPNIPPCPTTSIYYGNCRDYIAIIRPSTPVITATPAAAFPTVITGGASIPVAYTAVSGSLLIPSTGLVTVTAPTGFLISTTGTTWGNTAYIPYAGGTFSNYNVYIQFDPTTATSYTGNVSINGGGVPSAVTVPVSGTGTATACSGAPTPGTVVLSPTSGGSLTNFSLSLSGASVGGNQIYQWQSSPDGVTWTNIATGFYPTYSFTGINATTQYRCIVGCVSGNTTTSATSTSATATYSAGAMAARGCIPVFYYGNSPSCSSCGYGCSNYMIVAYSGHPLTMTGAAGTSITDNNNCNTAGYQDLTGSLGCTLNASTTYSMTLGYNNYGYSMNCQVWIDFNNDGTFQSSETVGGGAYSGLSTTIPIVVPGGVPSGTFRMCVITGYTGGTGTGYPAYPNMFPCPSYTGATMAYYGDCRDYKITLIGGAAPCSGQPQGGIVNVTPQASCSSFTANLFNVGETSSPGMSYQWQASTTGPTSGFTNIAGATSSAYSPVISSVGTIYYRDSVRCSNSGLSAKSSALGATLNASPTPITGPTNLCAGSTATLGSTPAGGTWTTSNPAAITVSGTGVITGIAAGVATITYTLLSGCIATSTITVNPQPGTITGPNTVCGSLSVTLSCSPGGGTWGSSATSIASVGSSSGVVTGGSAGTAVITYTLPTGCASSFPMTVNALSAITGTPSMCNGYTTTLADATPGGNWSSSNTSVATVNTTGLVTSVSVGVTTVSYQIPSTGCTATISVAVTNPPTVFSMTGGGATCPGGSVAVGLSGSNAGLAYTLYNGTTPILPAVTGVGFAFTFPSSYTTTAGVYTVIAANGTPCATNMLSSSTVVINPVPTPYTVSTSGSGSYCSGGPGLHVFLSSSQIGVNYQLFLGTAPVGAPISGTSAALDFGFQTAAGVYSVYAYNATTGCNGNMANTVTISISPLPSSFAITGGGGYCTGLSGVNIGLANSVVGVSYQLLIAGVPTGAAISGSGAPLNFGLQSLTGTYSIMATNSTTGCTSLMSGTTTVTVNPLPTVFVVTGGGGICPGGAGADVQLNGSQIGVNYQLFRGTTALATMAGTGSLLDYGLQTTPGSYTVVATNPTSLCTSNMSSSANVVLNPLPALFTVAASAPGYCAGGTGVDITLSGSVVGTTYTLLNGSTIVTALSGTGSALDFGFRTLAGSYSVTALITSTGCSGSMTGIPSVTVYSLPLPYAVSVSGGGVYCAGGAGQIISVASSQTGVNYQLYRGGVIVGTPVAGTGSAINFPAQTIAGTYTVVATNTVTLCTNNMTGSAAIIINPAPTVYNVTGGGGYCAGGAGNHIGLSSSDIGFTYQLYNGGTVAGAPVAGAAGPIDFGVLTAAGTYTVTATNTATGCTGNMSGSAVISINPLPAVNNLTTTGSTSFCAGSTGAVIGLNGSVAGINYSLYNGTSVYGTPVAGTGSPITFGSANTAGIYTATATNAVTGCTSNMTGSAALSVLPLPTAFNVTGGGAYCIGGAGMHVNLSNSQPGKRYQLFNLSGPVVGALLNGNGFALDFGAQTVASTYTVLATDTATLCTNNMTGSVTISINPLPITYAIGGGGNYCSGSAGPHVTLSNSQTGVLYQLFVSGTPTGAPVPGTGSLIDFGAQTTAGSYTISGTNTTTGCSVTMTGTITIGVSPLPTAFNVTGGGNYCPGGTGVHIGLSNSISGTVYQLYRGSALVGTALAGVGAPLDFGLQTVSGTYTVVATNLATGCTGPMTGSVTVGVASLPVVFNVTGTSNYCPGGAGSHVGLSGSSTGVTYQLFRGGISAGLPFTGTGSALDFGLWTTGTYTVVATNTTTTCTNNMNGSAVIGISPLPASHTVTGGGNYCAGGTGVHIGLDGSDVSTWYQLYNGVTAVGSAMAGTGFALDFGLQTGTGVYTIFANSTTTTCASGMSGSVTVGTNPLPLAFGVTGGGNYCIGGTGVDVSLSGSASGISYQLYNGSTMVGSTMAGTGSSLDFGHQTLAGTYTVVASNTTTSCINNMTGSVNVVINTLPTAYTVTGGGNYCSGSGGVHVMLSGSDVGTSYQLFSGGIALGGPVAGTGLGLDFGLQTAAGTYTVVATNPVTTCTGNMSGSVTIGINPLPTSYTLSGSGTTYCAGGAGIDIVLSGSDIGTNYQLYNGTTPVGGSVAGTSAALDFGYHTGTGTYSVVAVSTSTSCSSFMSGSVTITIGSLPVAYTVTGGGNFCSGGAGVHIGLSGSNTGVTYQLYQGTVATGGSVIGTGASLDFGLLTGSGIYTVVATKTGTTCTNNMAGSATISVVAPPTAYTVTGGGNFCISGSGVHVGLSGSVSGNTYQLYRSGIATGTAVPGTGLALDFGLKTAGGTYTVMATNAASGCTSSMTGSVLVNVESLPTAFPVTGGGNYCPGGTGVHVGVSGSASGITYQLYNGTVLTGSSVTGTGTSIDFGLQTTAGTYTVVASNGTTGCSSNMSGTAVVGISSLPATYTVMGGGNYCEGGTGVHIGLSGSDAGISYQAYNSYAMTGTAVIGTGGPLDLGAETASGTYTVIGTDPSTTCSSNMTGSADVVEVMSVSPTVSISSSGGDTVCSGILTNFSAVTVNGGTAPVYRWTVNGVVTGTSNHYSYIPVNGDLVAVTLTSNVQCATPSVVNNAKSMTVNVAETPTVVIAATPGVEVCHGTSVTFTATETGGGSAPAYSWIKNGLNAGTTSSYSYIPSNGDNVYCIMTSNYHCRSANTGTSNQLNMIVDNATTPVVNVSVNPAGNINPGQTVTFTATASSAGPAPTYQWLVNGVVIPGATFPAYSGNNFNGGDNVCCQVTSSGGCPGIMGESCSTVHLIGVGVQPVVFAGSDIRLIPNPNNGVFTLKGTLGTTNDEEMTVEVTDVIGQVIYTGKINVHNGDLNERIQLSNLANGMYLVNLRSGSDYKVFHMVIEQ